MPAIPDDAQTNGGNSNYFKITPGDHKVRILAPATIGYVWWQDEAGNVQQDGQQLQGARPKRVKKSEATKLPMTAKTFWAFPIWNHATNTIQIWEVVQGSIQTKLKELDHDKDWGDLTGYDLGLNREGTGKNDTRYNVTPKPKVALNDDIKGHLLEQGLPNMEALFLGEDPFAETVGFNLDDLPF